MIRRNVAAINLARGMISWGDYTIIDGIIVNVCKRDFVISIVILSDRGKLLSYHVSHFVGVNVLRS